MDAQTLHILVRVRESHNIIQFHLSDPLEVSGYKLL